MAAKDVSGALIGCGTISRAHLKSMKEAGIRIAALCDVDEDRAKKQKAEFCYDDTQVFTDYQEMLALPEIGIVAVLTPPYLHQEHVVAALKAGKFVYCEKPVVKTLKGFDDIFAAEKESGKGAFFTPCRLRGRESPMIQQYINDGDLGSIYRVDATHFRTRGRPGVDSNLGARWFADSEKAIAGIMGDMGMYFMDKCLHLTGWPKITAVSAMTFKEFPFEVPDGVTYDVEEHVVILARTAGKLTFTFEFANIAHYDHVTTFTMLGTKGGIHMDGRGTGIKYRTEKGGPYRFVEQTSDWKEGKSHDVAVYEELAQAVRGRSTVQDATTSQQAFVLHEISQMAFLSAHERREVRPEDLDHTAPIFLPCR